MTRTPLKAPGEVINYGWARPLFTWSDMPEVYALEWVLKTNRREAQSLIWQASREEIDYAYHSDTEEFVNDFIEYLNGLHEQGLLTLSPKAPSSPLRESSSSRWTVSAWGWSRIAP